MRHFVNIGNAQKSLDAIFQNIRLSRYIGYVQACDMFGIGIGSDIFERYVRPSYNDKFALEGIDEFSR